MDGIVGRFRVQSDRDGTFYKITFKPDRPQTWSAQPDGFNVTFRTIEETKSLLSTDRSPELRDARLLGRTEFTGHVLRDVYMRYAKF